MLALEGHGQVVTHGGSDAGHVTGAGHMTRAGHVTHAG